MTPRWRISQPRAMSTSSFHVCIVLNQFRAIACQSTHPLGMHHVFPHHRIRTPSTITLLQCCHQTSQSSVSVRLSSPTQPNLSDYNHAPPCAQFTRHVEHWTMWHICMHANYLTPLLTRGDLSNVHGYGLRGFGKTCCVGGFVDRLDKQGPTDWLWG
jgi:hypothetical protein